MDYESGSSERAHAMDVGCQATADWLAQRRGTDVESSIGKRHKDYLGVNQFGSLDDATGIIRPWGYGTAFSPASHWGMRLPAIMLT